MYSGYLINDDSRKKLLEQFPPTYPNVIAHHITETFGVTKYAEAPKNPTSVKVIGYINNDENVEGLLVEVNGKVDRASGSKYHITWSLDKSTGAKPFDTNKYVNDATPVTPIHSNIIVLLCSFRERC